MLLLDAGDLLAEGFIDDREGIGRGGVGGGVVDGVDAEEQILRTEVVVGARGAEVFADSLLGIAESARDAGGLAGGWVSQFRAIGRGPELQQIGDARGEADVDEGAAGAGGKQALARIRVGDECDVAKAEVLSVTLVVAKEEDLVATDGTAERAAEVVALKFGNLLLVEVVAGVERAIAQELIGCAMQSVGAAGGDDADLRALALAECGGVGVAGDVELAHGIDAEQLAAGATRRNIDE